MLLEPQRRFPERLGREPDAMDAAVHPPPQQPRRLEHAQVAGDGRRRQAEGFRQLSDGGAVARQAREDLPASGMGERREHRVEIRVSMVNHVVNYKGGAGASARAFWRDPPSFGRRARGPRLAEEGRDGVF